MKRTLLIYITFFCLNITFSQTLNQQVIDDKGKAKLLGKINKDGLTQSPYSDWFNDNHDEYIVNHKLLKTIKDSISQYTIKVFLGTWCGDSKREVPRFYKVLEDAKFPESQLEVIALDRTEEAYKQSPNGEEKHLNIHRVPTFIFFKDGEEINRIVEYPKTTFEHDIKNIIYGKYNSNYAAANYLKDLMVEKGIDSLKTMDKILVPRLAEFVKGSRELNTLGYVSLRANKLEEALYIFTLNTKIFPYKYNVYDSLGEAYFTNKNYDEALKNYYKVLSLKPDSENAKEMIEEIKLVIN